MTLRDSKDAFRDYAAEKAKVDQLAAAIRSHAQAKNLAAELKNIDAELKQADALAKRTDGGALKALTALKSVTLQCQRAKTLADKLVEAEKKLPGALGQARKRRRPQGQGGRDGAHGDQDARRGELQRRRRRQDGQGRARLRQRRPRRA